MNLSIEIFLTLPAFKFFSASSILNKKFWYFTVLRVLLKNDIPFWELLWFLLPPSFSFY